MNSEVKFTLEDRELIAPVTALEFDKTGKLFVGEGPYLKIYETTLGKLVAKERVFESQRIHSIKLYDSNCGTSIVVCGGRIVSVLKVQNNESISKVEAIGEVSFNDWIWDVCLLGETTVEISQCVAAVTGHNAVWIWNFNEDRKWMVSQCEEQCILYCARFVGRILDHMWLACGTVFNEVLLWKVTDNKYASEDKGLVRKRLTGHDGVIFSVRYNPERCLLCSMSDDRSIKVWRAVFTDDYLDVTVSSEPMLTLYGHKARVWDCLILKQHIVSIGEDSMCLLWNSVGDIIRSWKGHTGKSIWSLACRSDEHMIATGGGDSAIRLWLVEDEIENTRKEKHLFSTIPSQHDMTSQTGEEIPRMIGLLHDTSVVVMTDKGNLYSFKWSQDQPDTARKWSLIRYEPEYSSYSIMALSDCRTIVALGNINGSIKLISLNDPSWCPLERKPYTDKVLGLHWFKGEQENHFNLFSCGPEGLFIWWTVECLKNSKTFNFEVKANFRLPYCRQRWPNSVFLFGEDTVCPEQDDPSLVLCGDRRGSLHVFKATTENEPIDPVQSLIGIHGRNGVTSICSNSGYIYTTGRDGYIRQYKLCGEALEHLDKKKVYKGMEWIDRVNFTPDGEVLVLGFHTVDFIIWSMTRNEVLFRITCGGGHRNWDIFYTTTDHGLTFTYLKQSTVNVHCWSAIQKQQCSSIIQRSFHGRETNCVCFIGSVERNNEENQFNLLATGSEDTTINIMIYNPRKINEQRFRKVVSCEGHISSVRCLAYIDVKSHPANETRSHEHLLFSGGSRASLKCWSLDIDSILNDEISDKSSERNTSLNSSCSLLAELRSLSRRSRKKKRSGSNGDEDFTCDIRFMSLTAFPLTDLLRSVWSDVDVPPAVGVIAGCSDGNLRFYVFNYELKTFTLIGQGTWNERCLLCVGNFFHAISTQSHVVVYGSDTAGYISFWDVTQLYIEHFACLYNNIDDTDLLEEQLYTLKIKNDECVLDNEGVEMVNDFKSSNSFGSQNCGSENLNKLKSKEDLIRPFCSHKLHQSGVNSVSLMTKENDQYLLCSGGDDGAVAFASFKIHGTPNDKIDICSWSMVSILDAHTSAATGVKLLDNNTALSASVDQRLKLWKINWNEENTKLDVVILIDSFWLDVVDVQDIDVHRDRNGLYCITSCGVGLQMLTVKIC